jgi:hypothetical protein
MSDESYHEGGRYWLGNGQLDDAAMIRIMARENATQQGNSGTARVGSIASALRYLAIRALEEAEREAERIRDDGRYLESVAR